MRIDGWMAGALAALTAFGVVVQVRLAGAVPAAGGFLPLAAGVAGGLLAGVVCGREASRRALLGRGRWAAYGVAVALVAALLVFGRRYRGGLYLPGRLNPSELVKLCLVVFAAGGLAQGTGLRRVAAAGGACAVLLGLVAATGDFGLVAQLALTLAALAWAASWLWGGLAAFALAGGAWLLLDAPVGGHLATRLAVWRDPFADMTGAGWQTLQGLTAVARGGVTGAGFGLGDAQAVPIVASDFVYAAVAEDLGLAGGAAVLGLWALALARGLWAAARWAKAGDAAAALLAAGLSASLAVQVALNVAGVLNALPMTGITLPLVSHGGSSLATTLVMCGMLLGLSRRADAIVV